MIFRLENRSAGSGTDLRSLKNNENLENFSKNKKVTCKTVWSKLVIYGKNRNKYFATFRTQRAATKTDYFFILRDLSDGTHYDYDYGKY